MLHCAPAPPHYKRLTHYRQLHPHLKKLLTNLQNTFCPLDCYVYERLSEIIAGNWLFQGKCVCPF